MLYYLEGRLVMEALHRIIQRRIWGRTSAQWVVVICVILPVALSLMIRERIIDRRFAMNYGLEERRKMPIRIDRDTAEDRIRTILGINYASLQQPDMQRWLESRDAVSRKIVDALYGPWPKPEKDVQVDMTKQETTPGPSWWAYASHIMFWFLSGGLVVMAVDAIQEHDWVLVGVGFAGAALVAWAALLTARQVGYVQVMHKADITYRRRR